LVLEFQGRIYPSLFISGARVKSFRSRHFYAFFLNSNT